MELQEDAVEAHREIKLCCDCNSHGDASCIHDNHLVDAVHLNVNPLTGRATCPWCCSALVGNCEYRCKEFRHARYSQFECGSIYMINYISMTAVALLTRSSLCELNRSAIITYEDDIV